MKLPAAWRSGWWMWALPLTFCCVNALALFSHPGLRGEGFADMESRLTEEHVAVASLESKDRELAERLATALAGREGVQGLYEERFSTEAERLTELITHVKSLVNRAGLEAASISYPEEAIEEYGLHQHVARICRRRRLRPAPNAGQSSRALGLFLDLGDG